jgi:glycosyltransferase involved in cell wall biosynthesis
VRIGLNLLHAQPAIGGGWNYIANLVAGLAEHAGGHEFVAFVTSVSASIVPVHPQFQIVRVPIRGASRIVRVLYENVLLPALGDRTRLDVLHWFANTHAPLSRTPSAVTMYDLLAFTPAAPWGVIKLAYLRSMIRSTVKSADILLPISYATATELQTRLDAQATKMAVIPAVLPGQFRPESATNVARFRRKYALPDRFWLYVAHFYPHKNHKTLFEAYRLLLLHGGVAPWPLVLRGDGPRQELERHIRKTGLDRHVLFLPRLDETELPALYSSATALVFPSMHEGIGIPIIEAMACGCPVIAAAQPAVLESGQDAIWAINEPSADEFFQAMRILWADTDHRAHLGRLGIERAHRFRSDVVVPRLLEAYDRVAQRQSKTAS